MLVPSRIAMPLGAIPGSNRPCKSAVLLITPVSKTAAMMDGSPIEYPHASRSPSFSTCHEIFRCGSFGKTSSARPPLASKPTTINPIAPIHLITHTSEGGHPCLSPLVTLAPQKGVIPAHLRRGSSLLISTCHARAHSSLASP